VTATEDNPGGGPTAWDHGPTSEGPPFDHGASSRRAGDGPTDRRRASERTGHDDLSADGAPDGTGPGGGGASGLGAGEDERPPDLIDKAREWAVALVGAVVVAVVLRAFVVQVFYIPSESMESTLLVNDRVVADKVAYRFTSIDRGDVVVFERPEDVPGDTDHLIKRVIGLAGDTVEIREGTVRVNDDPVTEPYLGPGTDMLDFGPVDVPDGQLFVMGDNRDESTDSRVFGAISEDLVAGRAVLLIWPLDRFGRL
jgi:signal peptidase I